MTSRLHERYSAEVVPALQKQFEYGNPNQVPKVSKIVVNIGLGEALSNAKALDAALGDLTAITGQKPIVTKAKRSIAQFHLRTGNTIGFWPVIVVRSPRAASRALLFVSASPSPMFTTTFETRGTWFGLEYSNCVVSAGTISPL